MSFLSKFILIAIALLPLSQAQTPGKPAESTGPSSAVAANQPVITVRGLCPHSDQARANDAACTRSVSREEFDALVNSLNPEGATLPPNARQNLAKTFAEYLAIDAAAEELGMEDTLQFRVSMEFLRLKTVSELYRRKVQEKYRNPPQEEIAAYYKQHLSEYETVKLLRVLVPRQSLSGEDKDKFEKKADETAQLARQRLTKGEDPEQVQKDVYLALGLGVPPATDLGDRRRNDLVKEEAAELFALNPGEVSQVEKEAKNYVIYKVATKGVVPEDRVKNDLAREIYQKNFREAMKLIIDAVPVEFNEQYFGPASSTAASSNQSASPASKNQP